jgi:aminopeptidase N
MGEAKPKSILRSAYRPPDYGIDAVDLAFDLGESETFVEARLDVRRRGDAGRDAPPLVLDGEDLELLEIAVDGRPLAARDSAPSARPRASAASPGSSTART